MEAFAPHSYILKYPMVLLVGSEGPDQTTRAFFDLGPRWSHMPEDTFSHVAARMI